MANAYCVPVNASKSYAAISITYLKTVIRLLYLWPSVRSTSSSHSLAAAAADGAAAAAVVVTLTGRRAAAIALVM